ncbi:VOC family protein [Hydrogenibacillus schlegelii]|uniref:Catechol 2,3-dioxygenase n=1 Tax=Hydrogenibacillus schlegelii TaxID=1484 RepID=A0A132MGQ4_HYDSH|nr:VOC family protein [Hydrogenibacillus schlegelii]KWW97017.1 catechol 1,2-dioxygenase [Hydrogenibacillus schlegelii]OAR05191.1 catechol 2,3-dioxygenase [Hydrogenibacillus schlegelii]
MGKRRHWIERLAHVELLTPKPEESLVFFRDLLGLEVTAQKGDSVYLRGWGDWFHHTVKLTAAKEAGVGHIGWRTESPEDLEEAARFLEGKGLGVGWAEEGDLGQGQTYRFRLPDGHQGELFFEVERYSPPSEKKPLLKNRPQKRPYRGADVRRIDHVNLYASDPTPSRELFQELGFKWHEGLWVKNQVEMAAWMAVSNLSHDLAFMRDPTGAKGRLNHLAFWVDTEAEVIRAAELLREAGVFIEYGPGRHGISEAFFLYVYEPGGNRIEVYSGGYLNFDSDWGPILWDFDDLAERALATAVVGGPPPESMFAYGTPPVMLPQS